MSVVDVRVPKLGMSAVEVDVTRVLVAAGQAVGPQDPVAEVESEKVTFEVEAGVAGTVVEVLVADGDACEVGDVIVRVETA